MQKIIRTVGGEESEVRIFNGNKLRMLVEVIVERAINPVYVFEEEKVSANEFSKLIRGRCSFELQTEALQILQVQVLDHYLTDRLVGFFAQPRH